VLRSCVGEHILHQRADPLPACSHVVCFVPILACPGGNGRRCVTILALSHCVQTIPLHKMYVYACVPDSRGFVKCVG
jgi:hypothetical protein